MKKIIQLTGLLCLLTSPASGATYNFTPSTPLATIVTDLAVTGPNTYNFTAGNYTQITSVLTFPCGTGNVYEGPVVPFVVGSGVTPTANLEAAFTGSSLVAVTGDNAHTTPGSGCTIQYLGLQNQNVYIAPPVSGLLFQFNKVYGLLGEVSGGGNTTAYAAAYVDNGTNQDIGYSTFEWNQFGPSCSDVNSLYTDEGGTCGGIVIHGSNVNVTIQDNLFTNIEEGVHTLAQGTGAQIGTNLLIANNDFTGIHRIAIENQQGQVTNQQVVHNDIHDPLVPTAFSFGISQACCFASGGSVSPANLINDNVIIENGPCDASHAAYCQGYGIEFWTDGGTANNNLIQGYWTPNPIAFGGADGATTTDPTAINNVIQSPMQQTLTCEEGGTLPTCTFVTGTITSSPNSTSLIISAVPSVAPTVSIVSNVVTITELGTNTLAYYTTDGTTPVPGQGTTLLYSAPFTVASGVIVRAVGQWGEGANPLTYPAGFGYIPSAIVQAVNGTVPTVSSVSLTGSPTTVSIGSTTQLVPTCTYSNGSETFCGTIDQYGTIATYTSGTPATGTVSSSGQFTGLTVGTSSVTASAGGHTSSGVTITVADTLPAGSHGTATEGETDELNLGFLVGNYIIIGAQPVNPVSCTMFIGTGWAPGDQIDCIITTAPTPTTQGPGDICWGTWIEPASAPTNIWITIPMPASCGALTANTSYWIFQSATDDGNLGATACPEGVADCTGSATSGHYPAYYVAQNYAQYNSVTTSLAGNENTTQESLYITTVPATPKSVGRGKGTVR